MHGKDWKIYAMKIKIHSINARILWTKNSTLIIPYISRMQTLVLDISKLRLFSRTSLHFLWKNSKTENVIPRLFKARKPSYCVPEASRNVPESKPSSLTRRIGRITSFCSCFFLYPCILIHAFFVLFNIGFVFIGSF